MKRSLLISFLCTLCLFDTVIALAGECSNTKCKNLGYVLDSATKCNGRFFTCPVGGFPCYKCDETAKAGDIKYSTNNTAGTGWLLCDGSVYDEVKYPELKDVIGKTFGGTDTEPKLPDYRGMFLRGYGYRSSAYKTGYYIYKKQDEAVKSHSHYYTPPKWDDYSDYNVGNTAGTRTRPRLVSAIPTVDASGDTYTCPVRYGLYTFIYAGYAAN